MIKASSKYKMFYYNISQLENLLNKNKLSTGLWSIHKAKLETAFSSVHELMSGQTFNFLKDINPTKGIQNETLYRGLFIVISERTLTESEMQILLTQYLTENPNINNKISLTSNESNDEIYNTNLNDSTVYNSSVDLNQRAKSLDEDNLVFGVIDDINHLEVISKIEGIDIIKNFGDFKKIYFSIPSFRQDEVLAHSVTILKSIKCKKSLMDFIVQ